MKLPEYYDALKNHDWHYQYSDDHRVYLAGERERSNLLSHARRSPEHQKLYQEFRAYTNGLMSEPERPSDE
jgi:hypothetical protein